jgi:NDP-sugar pyrophosphorylase family protein
MTDSVAGVVLAAGRGERMRPLTTVRPKALCPVLEVPLVDLAIDRFAGVVDDVAVNVHHGRAAMEAHLDDRVHRSVEVDEPLGTAGALAHLRGWLDGRAAMVVNADAWCPGGLAELLGGWDGHRQRVLVAGEDELHPSARVAGAIVPWAVVEQLEAAPSGLWEVAWAAALAAGELDVVRHDGPFVDCGTPADYLSANLQASGGESVVSAWADVRGTVVRSVVWPECEVRAGEVLVDAIRFAPGRTVYVRGGP